VAATPSAAPTTKQRLAAGLQRVIAMRRALAQDPQVAARVLAVKQWQAERLRRTYTDLLQEPRYRAACEFFLEELYGAKDFTQRDEEALRIVPKLAQLLPEHAVATIALGVELDELSETLDRRVAATIRVPLDADAYAAAYRSAGTPEERAHQIEMVDRIGEALDQLARIRVIPGLLHLMRGPAAAAGLSHLHRFLSRGFDAFRAMNGARAFLDAIRARESDLMKRLFAGASQ
jgi:hypothetical protein